MILYSQDSSPYSAAVRVAVYAKNLQIEIAEPPNGLRSSRFHSINPLGTIPCLVHGDLVLPESVAILEYIEEMFPNPALLPSDPASRATVRVVQRIAELGVLTPSVELARVTATNEPADGSAKLTRLLRGLASADAYLGEGKFAIGSQLTLADCQLSVALSLVRGLVSDRRIPDLLSARPRLLRYLAQVEREEHVGRVFAELRAGSEPR